MLYGQATGMPCATQRSIASLKSERCSKIAAKRLTVAAHHQHESDVEDVAAPRA